MCTFGGIAVSNHIRLDPIVTTDKPFFHPCENDDNITFLDKFHIDGLLFDSANETFPAELRSHSHVEDATVEKHVLRERLGGEDGEDGALRAKLRYSDGLLPRVREENNEAGAEHVGRRDGVIAHRFLNAQRLVLFEQDRLLDVVLHLVVLILLSFVADFAHVVGCFAPIWPK